VPVRRVSAVAVLAIAIRPVSRRHPEVPIWRGGERLGTVVRARGSVRGGRTPIAESERP
jgi:hypothetical protein